MKIVIVSGGFDPLHSGHINHFEAARGLGDKLIIALNSDDWLARKKGQPFMQDVPRVTSTVHELNAHLVARRQLLLLVNRIQRNQGQ